MKLRTAATVAVLGCMVVATAAMADGGRNQCRRGNSMMQVRHGQVRHETSRPAMNSSCRQQQPARQVQCEPRPVPCCEARPQPRTECGRQAEPRRHEGERCRQQEQVRGETGHTRPANHGTVTDPANSGTTTTTTTESGTTTGGSSTSNPRVHDDNGHGNDVGHTDPSNPGNGQGNHGTRHN